VGQSGLLHPNLFCAPQILLCSENLFEHTIKIKMFRPKMCFAPQTLKPGYRPDSAKIAFEIRIFCFECQSDSRCSIMSNVFYKSLLGVPMSILWDPRVELLWDCYGPPDLWHILSFCALTRSVPNKILLLT